MTATTLPLPTVTADVVSRVFYAESATHPGITHTLAVHAGPAWQLRTTCTCPAGRHARPERRPIPCRHARAVATYLEQMGDAECEGTAYRLTIHPDALFDDLALDQSGGDLSPLERLTVAASAAGLDLDTVLAATSEVLARVAA